MSKVIKVKSKETGAVFHMKGHKFHPAFHELVKEEAKPKVKAKAKKAKTEKVEAPEVTPEEDEHSS